MEYCPYKVYTFVVSSKFSPPKCSLLVWTDAHACSVVFFKVACWIWHLAKERLRCLHNWWGLNPETTAQIDFIDPNCLPFCDSAWVLRPSRWNNRIFPSFAMPLQAPGFIGKWGETAMSHEVFFGCKPNKWKHFSFSIRHWLYLWGWDIKQKGGAGPTNNSACYVSMKPHNCLGSHVGVFEILDS